MILLINSSYDFSILLMKMCVVINGKRNGPHEPEVVRNLINSGKLSRETLAWKTGMEDWQPLHNVYPELFGQNGDSSIIEAILTGRNDDPPSSLSSISMPPGKIPPAPR